ncbi:hypothetical protein NW768_002517 [Fusarium equiseti]|uniref:Cell wall mannoprotein n=1 Tax=Fusarium equiseti TaxID=61235 RepID=A0ABQ8RNU7_FUSEQ|nr:hypothetical protein NW768_002517 [Fusarium equiseti]
MKFSAACVALSIGAATASPAFRSPIVPKHVARSKTIHKRQVPQEHSHDFVLNITKEFLELDNPKEIADPVFGLLGDAAAEEGAGQVTNLACLKQETADQAFTNAKAISDLRGMAGALLFQAIERNSAKVGAASELCTETAVNPEIAALTQHQDAAGEGAEAVNKAVTLELAKQLAAMGADPNLALLSGTFAPGDLNDATGAGNSCDDEEPELGCIFSQGLLVLDATEDEISSAVADVAQTFTGTGGIFATDLVDLASFSVASNTAVADLKTIVNGAAATDAAATDDAAATEDAAATATDDAATATDDEAATATESAGKGCAVKTTATGITQTAGTTITTAIRPGGTGAADADKNADADREDRQNDRDDDRDDDRENNRDNDRDDDRDDDREDRNGRGGNNRANREQERQRARVGEGVSLPLLQDA